MKFTLELKQLRLIEAMLEYPNTPDLEKQLQKKREELLNLLKKGEQNGIG